MDAPRKEHTRVLMDSGTISLALMRGLIGCVFAWAGIFGVLFCADLTSPELTRGLAASCALAGLTLGVVAALASPRVLHRGPEIERHLLVLIALVAAVLLVVCGLLPAAICRIVRPIVWFFLGLIASYTLRRFILLSEAIAEKSGESSSYAAVLCTVFAVAGVIALGISRMDALGSEVFLGFLLPAALALLPQGRLSLTSRAPREQPSPANTSPRSAKWAFPLCASLAATAIVVCISLAYTNTSLSSTNWLSLNLIAIIAAALAVLFVSRYVAKRLLPLSLQIFLAATLVMAILLPLTSTQPEDFLLRSCECLLIFCACCSLILTFLILLSGSYQGFAQTRSGRAALFAQAWMIAGAALGWVVGSLFSNALSHTGIAALSAVLLLVSIILVGAHREPLSSSTTSTSQEALQETELDQPIPRGSTKIDDESQLTAAMTQDSPVSSNLVDESENTESHESPREHACNEAALRYGLSEREHDLLYLLYDGLNAQQIADTLYISRNTAKTHMAHIYSKMGIHTRDELMKALGAPESTEENAALSTQDDK